MACALSPDTDVDAVYAMPHAEKVEHPAQLAGATRVVYTLEGDESPKPEPGALTKKKKNSKATSSSNDEIERRARVQPSAEHRAAVEAETAYS
jgi:hypothetical protein